MWVYTFPRARAAICHGPSSVRSCRRIPGFETDTGYSQSSGRGKARRFPSGHTAIALTVLILSYKYARNIFRVLLVPVALLIFATVYCRYHYVVDVMGGMVLTVVTFAVGEVYYKFWMRQDNGFPYSKAKDGIIIEVKVDPRSSRNEIVGVVDKTVRIKLTPLPWKRG